MIDESSVDDSDSEDDDGDVTNDKTGEYDAMIDEICYHYEDVVHNRQAEQQAGWAIRGTTVCLWMIGLTEYVNTVTRCAIVQSDVACHMPVSVLTPYGDPCRPRKSNSLCLNLYPLLV